MKPIEFAQLSRQLRGLVDQGRVDEARTEVEKKAKAGVISSVQARLLRRTLSDEAETPANDRRRSGTTLHGLSTRSNTAQRQRADTPEARPQTDRIVREAPPIVRTRKELQASHQPERPVREVSDSVPIVEPQGTTDDPIPVAVEEEPVLQKDHANGAVEAEVAEHVVETRHVEDEATDTTEANDVFLESTEPAPPTEVQEPPVVQDKEAESEHFVDEYAGTVIDDLEQTGVEPSTERSELDAPQPDEPEAELPPPVIPPNIKKLEEIERGRSLSTSSVLMRLEDAGAADALAAHILDLENRVNESVKLSSRFEEVQREVTQRMKAVEDRERKLDERLSAIDEDIRRAADNAVQSVRLQVAQETPPPARTPPSTVVDAPLRPVSPPEAEIPALASETVAIGGKSPSSEMLPHSEHQEIPAVTNSEPTSAEAPLTEAKPDKEETAEKEEKQADTKRIALVNPEDVPPWLEQSLLYRITMSRFLRLYLPAACLIIGILFAGGFFLTRVLGVDLSFFSFGSSEAAKAEVDVRPPKPVFFGIELGMSESAAKSRCIAALNIQSERPNFAESVNERYLENYGLSFILDDDGYVNQFTMSMISGNSAPYQVIIDDGAPLKLGTRTDMSNVLARLQVLKAVATLDDWKRTGNPEDENPGVGKQRKMRHLINRQEFGYTVELSFRETSPVTKISGEVSYQILLERVTVRRIPVQAQPGAVGE